MNQPPPSESVANRRLHQCDGENEWCDACEARERVAGSDPAVCNLRKAYKFGSECGQPAAYRIYGVDCYTCCHTAWMDACVGHAVCEEHAAQLRTESVAQVPARSGKNVPAFTVERIHSLGTDGKWLDAMFAEPERQLTELPTWARGVRHA